MRKLVVLIMSVGPYEKNGSAKYIEKIGGRANAVVVLPGQYRYNEDSYTAHGFRCFIYDEKKYINSDMEYFGFRPCNCGGIGRQGIAEAVDKFDTGDVICLQIDDDTESFQMRGKQVTKKKAVGWGGRAVKSFAELERLYNVYDNFYKKTGIKIHSKTGCTPLNAGNMFFSNRKAYNNFIMHREDEFKYTGFRYMCSDDVVYNYTTNLLGRTPFMSVCFSDILFTQNQGDRDDGNAVLYNKDCSWKKSFSMRMFNPLLSEQKISKEANRILFRETLKYSKLYPPIMLCDKNGKITHKLLLT